MGNFIGMSREHAAAFVSGGYPASSGGKDLTVSINTKSGTVSATVDVISANGNYVTVGGAAKANKLGS